MILIAKILLAIGIFTCFGAAIVLILSPLYFVKGYLKGFYHDIMEWHRPSGEDAFYDGCSAHDTCKYCGKDIMQDSQGNWF